MVDSTTYNIKTTIFQLKVRTTIPNPRIIHLNETLDVVLISPMCACTAYLRRRGTEVGLSPARNWATGAAAPSRRRWARRRQGTAHTGLPSGWTSPCSPGRQHGRRRSSKTPRGAAAAAGDAARCRETAGKCPTWPAKCFNFEASVWDGSMEQGGKTGSSGLYSHVGRGLKSHDLSFCNA